MAVLGPIVHVICSLDEQVSDVCQFVDTGLLSRITAQLRRRRFCAAPGTTEARAWRVVGCDYERFRNSPGRHAGKAALQYRASSTETGNTVNSTTDHHRRGSDGRDRKIWSFPILRDYLSNVTRSWRALVELSGTERAADPVNEVAPRGRSNGDPIYKPLNIRHRDRVEERPHVLPTWSWRNGRIVVTNSGRSCLRRLVSQLRETGHKIQSTVVATARKSVIKFEY